MKTEDHRKVYTVGIVPQFDSLRIHAIWRPILDEIQNRTGMHFVIQGSSTIPAFGFEFISGAFDFAYVDPYRIFRASKGAGYIPLVRDHGELLYGIIVVRKDSPVQSVKELAGKVIAFPAPNALGATLLTRAELLDKQNIRLIPRYVQTHTSVYLNVALKQVDAGGGVQKTLNQQASNIKNALRILYRTAGVAPHAFAVHPRIPAELQDKVKKALLDMGREEKGRRLLLQVPITEIGVATKKDYQSLVNMNLERFK